MTDKDWIRQAQELARGADPREALRVFLQHQDEALEMFFGESACAASASSPDDLFERDTREVAQIVAKWSAYAAPLDEDVTRITVDVSQPGETPLVTADTEGGGTVTLFDVLDASRANEAHLEDCRHVEASWGDWQDDERFLPLFCQTLTDALTQMGLPAPDFIRSSRRPHA